ncbi:DUF3231 family protein [Evansella tamaricis]|uniref:DUF3231 family protein n=1 Tax=Evansella tamaricis TaxID=2069301 RepID=A0ABS6JE64_9BACI|nr:DUF3231 family protein [Evansella tamaricis]MBU9711936.1 DUF3231 family protein [Evansella tamaricis]
MSTNDRPVKLSTSELADVWTAYMNDSMSICMISQFLQHIEDSEIEEVLQFALQLSKNHCDFIVSLFKSENCAIPYGFNLEEDVNLSAPILFSDTFYLMYLHNMGKIGANSFSLCLATSAREDLRNFFRQCVEEAMELFDRTSKVLLAKGLFLRPPQIELPSQVDFVEKQSFLNGWFGKRRPLNAIEVMNLYFNIERNQVGKSLITGFSQVTSSQEIAAYFNRGMDISGKYIEVFGSTLSEADLPSPMTWDTLPTTSTTSTFSDKLMMFHFHVTVLTGASVSHYGTSMGSSPRRDIGLNYNRLIQEILLFAEDGAEIMIDHGYLEQPPQAPNRRELSNKK